MRALAAKKRRVVKHFQRQVITQDEAMGKIGRVLEWKAVFSSCFGIMVNQNPSGRRTALCPSAVEHCTQSWCIMNIIFKEFVKNKVRYLESGTLP